MRSEECVERIMAQVKSTVERLFAESAEWREGHWLFDAEHATREAMLRAAQVVLQSLVDRRGTGHVGQWHEDKEGERRKFKEYVTRPVETLVGRITIRRASYHSSTATPGTVQPLDEEMGLRYEFSEGVEEVVAFDASQLTYAETVGVVEKALGYDLSETAVQDIAERWGGEAMRTRTSRLPREPVMSRMAVAVDAAKIRTATRVRRRKGSRKQRFEEHWMDAKLGVVYGIDRRGRGNSDKRYMTSVRGKEAFGPLLWAQIEASGADRAKHIAWLGDGAEWIWSLKDEHLPHATEILDFQHAQGYLKSMAGAVWPADASRAADWVESRKKRLLHGKVRALITELKDLARRVGVPAANAAADDPKRIAASSVTYFEHNSSRMQYHVYLRMGYPISSGVVESGCRHVIQHRMKITGSMSWSEHRAETMLQLRCLVRSGQWDRFWSLKRIAA